MDQETNASGNAGISFDTDAENVNYEAIKFYKETSTPTMVKAVMKYSGGTIKNQRQAEWILFGFVVVAVCVFIYSFFGSSIKQVFSGSQKPAKVEALIHARQTTPP